MGFIKVVKNNAYFKRYQVKFRRRREARTDYYARKRLITQDKNKYKSPKYRLVVRITNKDVIAQIITADLTHDVCVASAYSHELKRYGLNLGLTNYSAAYCTGLLLARRVNEKYKLEFSNHEDVEEADEDGPAPFKALLDVGLARTTTGARVFAVLKGAADGGLNVPHKERRFPGSSCEDGEWELDAEVHEKYIFGGHVADYMRALSEDDEAYQVQFKRYIAAGIGADDLEALYTKVHEAIRANPNQPRDKLELGSGLSKKNSKRSKAKASEYPKKRWSRAKKTKSQRVARIVQKLRAAGVQSPAEIAAAKKAASRRPGAVESSDDEE